MADGSILARSGQLGRNFRSLWLGIVVLLLTTVIGMMATGLRVDFASNPFLLLGFGGYVGLTFLLARSSR
jgi:hypothetical protein